MKTKAIAMFAFICLLMGTNSIVCADTSSVDSVYNLLKGKWYAVYRVSGNTGHKSLIYNSDSTVISRIPGTDSIIWKDYENGGVKSYYTYEISYRISYIKKSNEWMLNDDYRLGFTENTVSTYLDVMDGGENGYARTQLVTGINNPTRENGKMILTQQRTGDNFSVNGLASIDRLEIYDLFGRIQRKTNRVNVGESIDISSLSAGIYLIKVYSGLESHTGKIIKK